MSKLSEKAAQNLKAVRDRKPLVHNLTNLVVMNYSANALLSMGASPVMPHAEKEMEEMVSHAGALVLNIGTLTDETMLSIIKAGKIASTQNLPIILDPVGAGATSLRTVSAHKIIAETKVSVLKGNASGILSFHRGHSKTRGVDSKHAVDDAAQTERILASELETTIAINGLADEDLPRTTKPNPTRGRSCPCNGFAI